MFLLSVRDKDVSLQKKNGIMETMKYLRSVVTVASLVLGLITVQAQCCCQCQCRQHGCEKAASEQSAERATECHGKKAYQSSSECKEAADQSGKIYKTVEQMPSYPGGNRALMEWIRKNVVYPDETCAQGRVIVGFVVERDGSVTNVEVIRGTSPELDRAAVEVVSRMPKWIPGKQKGQAVRCSYNVPVTFYNY